MIQIIDKKATGKTGRLFLVAKETGAVIVCNDPYSLHQKALNYGIVGLSFICYDEFWTNFKKNYYDKDITYVIDELDCFLQAMNKNILGYTLSVE